MVEVISCIYFLICLEVKCYLVGLGVVSIYMIFLSLLLPEFLNIHVLMFAVLW